ncbi:GHKL domain-containing protein [Trinickia violacea]|uniref:histidine kinase n=1 Tax=Trinickia violacea TaxID=2571746 RepID=A0A4P8IPF6_9BURK|nr:GHKL domain-containing protein [Trinickia violacea]
MLAKVPRISNYLRERTVSIAADLTLVVERTLAILTQLDGYKLLAPAAKQDVHESVALSAKVWFETLLSGEPPSAQDMDVFREISQRHEHQRVPLQSLLQSLRLGLGEIWSTYIALGELDERIAKELLADVSLYLLDYFDLIAQITVRAYLSEQYRQPRWAELAIAIEEGARQSESVRHHLVALLDRLAEEPHLLSRLEVEHAREQRGTDAASAQVMKFFGLDVDIDDREELSKALRDAQERLAQASRLAAVAELSASIAHEINQPLQAIVAHGRACVRWLAATPPRIDEAKHSAEQVLRDANAAADVVSRIRALFRHTAPQKVDLDINKLILQVCTLMADDIQRNAISLETMLGEDVPKISADAVQIQQVIVNLVRNAIEALATTEERPKLLVIRSRRDADNVVVDVVDHGPGQLDFEKIFEPFFTTKKTGMGIGLAICRSIIDAHVGDIWAVRNVSRGVTFSFSLPIARSSTTAH